jgi:hypothetical protein
MKGQGHMSDVSNVTNRYQKKVDASASTSQIKIAQQLDIKAAAGNRFANVQQKTARRTKNK